MAGFKFIDGFDSFGDTPGADAVGHDEKWSGPTSIYGNFDVAAGRIPGGYSLRLGETDTCVVQTPTGVIDANTISYGFAFKFSDVTGGLASFVTSVFQAAGFDQALNVTRPATGPTWELRGGTSVLLQVSSPAFAPVQDQQYYAVVKATNHSVSGRFEMWIYEDSAPTKIFDFTGNTGDGGNYEYVSFGASFGLTWDLDDFYVYEGEFLQESQVRTLFPVADGPTIEFTPSTGDNFENVDDVTPDEDSTYNESGVTGNRDVFQCTTLAGVPSVDAIMINARARSTSGDHNLKLVVESGAAESLSGNFVLGVGMTYEAEFYVVAEDPDTTDPWTIDAINDAFYGYQDGG